MGNAEGVAVADSAGTASEEAVERKAGAGWGNSPGAIA